MPKKVLQITGTLVTLTATVDALATRSPNL
jgi:hypothetical protein